MMDCSIPKIYDDFPVQVKGFAEAEGDKDEWKMHMGRLSFSTKISVLLSLAPLSSFVS